MTIRKPRQRIEFRADEDWLEITGHPRYLISTHGRVYSTISRKIMAPYWTDHGHGTCGGSWSIQVYENRIGRTIAVAYHVLSTFLGRPSGDWVPGYLDRDRSNVHLDNLEWRPRSRPELAPGHMAELARRGFAASPAAQANAGRAANFRRELLDQS